MNKEDIIRMAREARMFRILDEHASEYGNGAFENTAYPELERFAALVAAAQRKPLTNEEIEAIRIKEEFDLWGIREGAFKYCARSIEHAHGIKENP